MAASFTDRELKCVDCGTVFTFTSGQQEFFAEKGFTNDPKRCDPCRAAKKSQQGGGNVRGGDQRSNYGGGGGGQREMHSVVCSACGKPAQVPFKPRGDRPVYCSECFTQHR
jgi:CxxC-x17-CxxC domain-containing protein